MLFLRRESFKTYIREYPATSAFIALNTAMMLWTLASGEQFNTVALYRHYALIPSAVHFGEWWRLITFTIVHNGWMHFLFNMFMIYLIAPPLERRLGRLRFALLILLSAAATAALLMLVGTDAAVGASGVDFGLLGYYVVLLWRRPYWFDAQSRSVIVAFVLLGWLSTLVVPGVSFIGHLGGFLGGIGWAVMAGAAR
ncbi:MAG: rhomboid family intramembrane serine protease [Hydrogenibacillus sp.]|nr:rhomboid family intramembrane serine protease [Hydrogenibacillus sp.]